MFEEFEPADIHYQRNNGNWSIVLRSNFNLLLCRIMWGTVRAINAKTIRLEEVEKIFEKGFCLIPEEIGMGKNKMKILKIQKDEF